jgi:glycosyltransferase involved in cell wall biosynthesis
MRLADARIGYAGYSRDFTAPGDRRRFAAYARARGLAFEYAEIERDYDVVYATCTSDLPGWVARKHRDGPRFRFVFELIDAYLTETSVVRRYAKGAARYLLGADSQLSPDFRRTLIDACEAADIVVCSTDEQAAAIRQYNANVVISFDYFGDDLAAPKADYTSGEKLRLVWEGQSATLANLRSIRRVLNELRDSIELHVVTDPLVYRYFGRFLAQPTTGMLRGFDCSVHFHAWDRTTFSPQITEADVAIIPIDRSNAFAMGKPENKLVMFWQLGMPVLASDTPAYRRAMSDAGLDLLCSNDGEWRTALERMIAASDSERQRMGEIGQAYSKRAYSRDEFLRRFDRALAMADLKVAA